MCTCIYIYTVPHTPTHIYQSMYIYIGIYMYERLIYLTEDSAIWYSSLYIRKQKLLNSVQFQKDHMHCCSAKRSFNCSLYWHSNGLVKFYKIAFSYLMVSPFSSPFLSFSFSYKNCKVGLWSTVKRTHSSREAWNGCQRTDIIANIYNKTNSKVFQWNNIVFLIETPYLVPIFQALWHNAM